MINITNNTLSDELINQLNNYKNITWIEIGVHKGNSAYSVLTQLNIKKMYLIDPYSPLSYLQQYFGTKELVESSKETAHTLLKKFEDKIVWYEDFSENVVNNFENESIDIIYIDGNHSYDSVMLDLKNYYPKLKIGGLIIGDDYNERDVKMAIIDFSKEYNILYNTSINKLKDNIVNKFWLKK